MAGFEISEMGKAVLDVMMSADTKKDRFSNAEVRIKREGTQITLPSDPVPMRYDEAIECLKRKIKDEETEVSVNESVDAFPFDGAYAFMQAMKDIYGWASPEARETFFGPIPPTTLNLEVNHGAYEQIIWGDFKVPGIEGVLTSGTTQKHGRMIFCIKGKVKKKHQTDVARLAEKTREIVRTLSIYKGKSIRLRTNEDGELDLQNPPSFLDLSRVNAEELTFSEDVATQVQTSLFTPIEYTQACRMHQIPLKRGVLLEGPYGTGKTLTAFVTAQKARKNGWTFILIDRVAGLGKALEFARLYQPSVVFAEDVDRAISGDERTVEMDDILNTIDGAESKGSEVITILTSNNATTINKAMLRPGRLDAVISVQAPDAIAAQKLVRLYARGLISEKENLTDAGKELNGQIPAVIREVVERAKLYAIGREKSGKIKLACSDLVASARGMKHHLNLLNPKAEKETTVHERVGMAMAEIVSIGIRESTMSEVNEATAHTKKKVDQLHSRLI